MSEQHVIHSFPSPQAQIVYVCFTLAFQPTRPIIPCLEITCTLLTHLIHAFVHKDNTHLCTHIHTHSPAWHISLRCRSESVLHTHSVQVCFARVTNHSAQGEFTLYPIFLWATDPSINPSPHTPIHPSTSHPNIWPSISHPSVHLAPLPEDKNTLQLIQAAAGRDSITAILSLDSNHLRSSLTVETRVTI